MLTSPDQAPTHRPHTHSRDASPFTEAQQTQLLLDYRTHTLYGWTRLYGFNLRDFSEIPTIFTASPPHTHSQDASPSPRYNEPNPVCSTTGAPPPHYSFMGLRVLAHRKYRRPRSRPHLIDHIFGARITLILLFASLFY